MKATVAVDIVGLVRHVCSLHLRREHATAFPQQEKVLSAWREDAFGADLLLSHDDTCTQQYSNFTCGEKGMQRRQGHSGMLERKQTDKGKEE